MLFLLFPQTLTQGVIHNMNDSSGESLIQIKNLTAAVKLNNGDTLVTVNNASIELKRGNSYAIVGKSGSGKTSLISIIGLLNRSYKGEYLYDGVSVSALTDRELSMLRANNIGFVFQNYSLIKHLRVWENIELPLLYAKKNMDRKQRQEVIRNLLKSVGLEDKENDYPANLSGGEQQRVAIARALTVSPEAILCDEPTGALDKKTGQQIMELLLQIVRENNIMLLLVTHDSDIANTCDTIFEMDEGGFDVLKMIFKDLRISPLRNILTSISMLVGIIAMIGSFLVGTLGKDYLISVNAQMYGWTPTYSYSITDSDFQDSIKMEEFFYKIREIDDCVTITFDMRENIRFAPIVSVSSLQGAANDIYKKVVPVDVVLTTTPYNKIYNLPMSSGSWFSYSETEKSLCMVVNKEAESYFNTPYAVGNTGSSLSLTPFNVTGTVNDGKDIPTVYLDAQAVEEFLPNMWQVQNASVYWHLTKGLTTNQMYSSLDDILQDTIGGHIEYSGRSDIGDTYDSVLSMLQLGLLITSFLLLFVSVLGQINIGLSSLEQRTHELLIRRAIGASRINIVALVLGTQLVISIFVCIVSILLSILIVEGIGIFLPPDTPVASPAYPFFSAVVAVVASVTVALLGGLLPALKAAKLEPALALR